MRDENHGSSCYGGWNDHVVTFLLAMQEKERLICICGHDILAHAAHGCVYPTEVTPDFHTYCECKVPLRELELLEKIKRLEKLVETS